MEFDRNVPARLLELQTWFLQIETTPLRELGEFHLPVFGAKTSQEIEERITPGPHLSAVQRIGLYNQQYWFRSFRFLQERYPALLRLFGYGDFNGKLGEPYLLKYPNKDWLLTSFGQTLPQWIAEEYREEDREFILALAQIEAAYERLWYAPEPLPSVKFTLDGNLFAFRDQLLKEDPVYWEQHPFPSIDWFDAPRSFLLYREGTELVYADSTEGAFL